MTFAHAVCLWNPFSALGSGCGPSGLVGSSAQVLSTLTEEETEARESCPSIGHSRACCRPGTELGALPSRARSEESEVTGAPEADLSSAGLRAAQLWSGFEPRGGCRRGRVVMGSGGLRVAPARLVQMALRAPSSWHRPRPLREGWNSTGPPPWRSRLLSVSPLQGQEEALSLSSSHWGRLCRLLSKTREVCPSSAASQSKPSHLPVPGSL